jgi:hypothetical protein
MYPPFSELQASRVPGGGATTHDRRLSVLALAWINWCEYWTPVQVLLTNTRNHRNERTRN